MDASVPTRLRPKRGFWFGFCVVVLRPLLRLLTKQDWRGVENLPQHGGFILASNHLSHVDPFVIAHYLYDNGRIPRFMAKAELFRVPVLGTILRGAGQIAVYRRSADASLALRDAVAALKSGQCVVIYPEGTTTKDPTYWPMHAKTGIARLALLSGAPVVPLGQWGANEIFGQDHRVRPLPRKTMRMFAGPVVDLSEYAGRDLTVETLRAVTDKVMAAVRVQVGEVRREVPPLEVFDPRRLQPVKDGTSSRRSA